MKVRDTNHVADFHDLYPRQVRDFVGNFLRTLSPTLLPTFPVHCNELNSIRATQTGLSQTCHGLCRKHLDMSRWFASATFVICVGDFYRNLVVSWFVTVCVLDFHDLCPRLSPREVLVKVGVMEFGLNGTLHYMGFLTLRKRKFWMSKPHPNISLHCCFRHKKKGCNVTRHGGSIDQWLRLLPNYLVFVFSTLSV